jgi:hypothetical protein
MEDDRPIGTTYTDKVAIYKLHYVKLYINIYF